MLLSSRLVASTSRTPDAAGDLYVTSASGADRRLLARISTWGFNDSIDWSPDGRKLAVLLDLATPGVVSVTGGAATKLVEGTDRWERPVWSPDGSTILSQRQQVDVLDPSRPGYDRSRVEWDRFTDDHGQRRRNCCRWSGHGFVQHRGRDWLTKKPMPCRVRDPSWNPDCKAGTRGQRDRASRSTRPSAVATVFSVQVSRGRSTRDSRVVRGEHARAGERRALRSFSEWSACVGMGTSAAKASMMRRGLWPASSSWSTRCGARVGWPKNRVHLLPHIERACRTLLLEVEDARLSADRRSMSAFPGRGRGGGSGRSARRSSRSWAVLPRSRRTSGSVV